MQVLKSCLFPQVFAHSHVRCFHYVPTMNLCPSWRLHFVFIDMLGMNDDSSSFCPMRFPPTPPTPEQQFFFPVPLILTPILSSPGIRPQHAKSGPPTSQRSQIPKDGITFSQPIQSILAPPHIQGWPLAGKKSHLRLGDLLLLLIVHFFPFISPVILHFCRFFVVRHIGIFVLKFLYNVLF